MKQVFCDKDTHDYSCAERANAMLKTPLSKPQAKARTESLAFPRSERWCLLQEDRQELYV